MSALFLPTPTSEFSRKLLDDGVPHIHLNKAMAFNDSLNVFVEQAQRWLQDPSALVKLGSSVLLAASLLPVVYHGYLLCQFRNEVPMSFSWIPILGHALEFGSNPIKTLQKLSKDANGKIKDIFGLILAGKRIILINNPLSFKVIFKSKKEVMEFTLFFPPLIVL
jgi:hypothetical protein